MTPIQSFIKICVSFSQQHLNFAGCLNPSRFLTEKFHSITFSLHTTCIASTFLANISKSRKY